MILVFPQLQEYVSAFTITFPQHEGIGWPAATSLLPHSAPMWQMYVALTAF